MIWIDISAVAVALAALCIWLVVVLMLRARRSQRRFEILGEVAGVSERAGSLEETFEAICDIIVPELADFCVIDRIEGGKARRVAVRVVPEGGTEVERWLSERKPSIPQWIVEGEDIASSPTRP